MKVLVTGMTASQVSEQMHARHITYAGLLVETLKSQGHEVVWSTIVSPQDFDVVFVGIAPIMSLGAQHTYTALDILADARAAYCKTILFVDTPDLGVIRRHLKSVQVDSSQLTKDFFKARPGFMKMRTDTMYRAKIIGSVRQLASDDWPLTIAPRFAWPSQLDLALTGICLDSAIDVTFSPRLGVRESWVLDKSRGSNRWLNSLNLSLPVRELPYNWRLPSIEARGRAAQDSVGTLIEPSQHGLWWTPSAVISLAAGVPVYADWQATQNLGDGEWSALAATIEGEALNDPDAWAARAKRQFTSYTQSASADISRLTKALTDTSGASSL